MFCSKSCLETAVGSLRWLRDLVEKRDLKRGQQRCITSKQQQQEKFELDDCDTTSSAPRSLHCCCDDDLVPNNIVLNPTFSDGTRAWFGDGCSISVSTCLASSYCVAHGRGERSHGLVQNISARLEKNTTYRVEAWVAIRSARRADQASVRATLKAGNASVGGDGSILLGRVKVKAGQWCLLTGTIPSGSNGDRPRDGEICIDGPDAGIDILVGSVAIVPTGATVRSAENQKGLPKQLSNVKASVHQDPLYDVNIVVNNDFQNGLDGWYAMGNSKLSVVSGGPFSEGTGMVGVSKSWVNSRAPAKSSGGKYVCCSNRTETYEGPAQYLTGKIQPFVSYQMSAWVATSLPFGTTVVDVSIDVDGVWMQAGEALVGLDWVHIRGSFRLEEQADELYVYLQGPIKGVDVMLTGLEIFAVDRLARTPSLQKRAAEFRMRDVVVKLRDSEGYPVRPGTSVSVRQINHSFPLGSCINRDSLEDEFYTKFYLDNFNFAVFENELKWEETQPIEEDVYYKDADQMVGFCNEHNIPMRGHCIVWDIGERVPDWVEALEGIELLDAIDQRVGGLLTRYKGQFEHYDVNNEMLHGDFFEQKLGADFLPYLFKLCHELDPRPTLFVNEYDVENNYDCSSSPERYIELIRFLVENGARVGGIGVQGHVKVPMGSILADALDQLGELNLPIWFTELDVSSLDENVRADDLEVVLRELFAHPSVQGCLLWGFMEGAMDREDGCLINADRSLSAAGRRFLDLKKEWTTTFDGVLNENSEIVFRGFHGNYTLGLDGASADTSFEVTFGDSPLELNLTSS